MANISLFKLFSIYMFLFLSINPGSGQVDEVICSKTCAAHHLYDFNVADDTNTDVTHYDIRWRIDPNRLEIRGLVTPTMKILSDGIESVKFDLTTKLKVNSVKSGSQLLSFEQKNNFELWITLPTIANKGDVVTFEIDYSGTPNVGGLGSFSKGTHGNQPVIWNVSPPFGSQDWWPCKNLLSDKIDSIDIHITCPIAYKAASNGVLVSESESNGEYTCHWKSKYPIASYLVGMAVTNFARYSDTVLLKSGVLLPVLNYVYPENLNAAKTGTKELTKTLAFFDSLFVDYPFPLEKYGHAQFGFGGGMEHQTMSFVTDFSFGLLAHELAHQWFGDLVTCGDWEDTWLNEGSATYLEGLAQERFKGAAFTSWKINKRNNIISSPTGSVKVPATNSALRIFDSRLTYNKGAYVHHMLRWKLGDIDFFEGMRAFLKERAYGFARTSDFQRNMEEVSGQSLSEFFKDWYEGQGYPEYTVLWEQTGGKLLVKLQQKSTHPSVAFYEMPVPIRITVNNIKTILRLENTTNDQLFEFEAPETISKVEFDPELWLLAKATVKKEVLSNTYWDQTNDVQVFPNPTSGIVDIKGLNGDTNYTLYNVVGQHILKGTLSLGNSAIDIRDLDRGVYFIQVGRSHRVVIKE